MDENGQNNVELSEPEFIRLHDFNYNLSECSPSQKCQQNGFGRKPAKQFGVVWWQGIGSFCERGLEGEGKIIPAQVLAVLQSKGLERKEAFLLT